MTIIVQGHVGNKHMVVDGYDSDSGRFYRNGPDQVKPPIRTVTTSIHLRGDGVAIHSKHASDGNGKEWIVQELKLATLRNCAELLGYSLTKMEE